MAVVIETTLGDITVDLYLEQRPVTCLNFLKLCKMKYYNFNLFHSIRSGFIAQTGDPTGEGSGGQSIWGILEGPKKQYFSGEKMPKIRHTDAGLLSMVCTGDMMVGSQFFFTLAPDLNSLDGVHCVIGEVTEGQDVLRKLNDVICDETHRPFQDVRITHTVVLEDPFNDPAGLRAPSRSPSPSAERLKGGRIAPDEDLDETQGKSAAEIQELIEEKEAKARATILEIVGDLPDADIAPPENVLFVCKLNPVTTDEDLEIIFSRFGKIVSCEVIRDKKTGDSLQYAFIEFADKKYCENAYLKMDNVLIDDRRIHVDFSQSVSKIKWLGKGRGVKHMGDDDLKEDFFSKNRNKQPYSRDNDRYSYRGNEKDIERRNNEGGERYDNRENYYERQRKSDRHDPERDTSRKERHLEKNLKHLDNDRDSRRSKREKCYEKEKISERTYDKERDIDKNERKERLDRYSRSEKDPMSYEKTMGSRRERSLERNSTSKHDIEKNTENNLKSSRNERNEDYAKHAQGRNNEKERNYSYEKDRSDIHEKGKNEREKYVDSDRDLPNKIIGNFEKHDKSRNVQKRYTDPSNERSMEYGKQRRNTERYASSNERSLERQEKSKNNDSYRDLKKNERHVSEDKDNQMDRQDKKSKNKSVSDKHSKKDDEQRCSQNKLEVDIPEKRYKSNAKQNTEESSKSQKKTLSNKKDNEKKHKSHEIESDVKLSPSRKYSEMSSDNHIEEDNKNNGEVKGGVNNFKRHNEKPLPHKSKKSKPSDSNKEKSKLKSKKAERPSKGDKKRKRKRKQSTSSESDSTTSSSSSESNSSEEDRKKKRSRRKKKRYSSSSSSESSSSSSSTSSDSSSSSSSSSSSDNESKKKKKTKKKVVKKSKKK